MAEKRIKAVIGRSADFYGEYSINSTMYISFLQNMLKGKAPQVLGQKNTVHSYAYAGDNGRALVLLALDDRCYGQVWHLPVGKPVTFEEINELMNSNLETNFQINYIPSFLRKILSYLVPPIKEVEEMLFQFQKPYEMNFEKFKKHFPDFKVTSYENGIKRMIESFR
jgi:nucleoside-diphosphate-sugar epimerase